MEPIDEPYGQPGAEVQGLASPIAEPASPKPTSIAPAWHTVLLILGILAVSLLGVYRHPGGPGVAVVNRLHTYGVTAGLEVVLMGWVAFGLRLRGIPFRSLFGKVSGDFRSIAVDVGIAILFWMGSMMTLATLALMWMSIEAAITHRPIPIPTGTKWKDDLTEFDGG